MAATVGTLVLLVGVFSGSWAQSSPPEGEGVHTPALEVTLVNGTGFNIFIPDAGKEMVDFRYYVSINSDMKDVKEMYCKGRVECISPKSRFRLHKDREMKEGDVLYFYLIGNRKPDSFQMERVYEVKKNDEGSLEFQEKSSRAGLEKEGLWYEHDKLDKLQETDP